ncbi:hypothetical protein K9M79_07645 [Candidatus Woesearchaeota archaeon]|nr:hypothetical protein [Candidatus Woesearchaeota archaeon]
MKKVSLLFSGGIDSSLAVIELAKDFDEIHLLTMDRCSFVMKDRVKVNLENFRKATGRKIIHKMVPMHKIIKKLHKNLFGDMMKYMSPFVIDQCCRVAMATSAILYNKMHGIKITADGDSIEQSDEKRTDEGGAVREQSSWTYGFEQSRAYKKHIADLYDEYGMELISPVYDAGTRDIRMKKLNDKGIITGSRRLSRFAAFFSSCQPFCVYQLYGSPLLKLDLFTLTPDQMIKYLDSKKNTAREHITGRKIS